MGAGAREPAGSRLRYLVLGYDIRLVVGAGLRVCGCAGLRVLGCVIRLVWLCGCAGFGQRYLAGVVVRVCGVRATLSGWCGGAGARGSGNVIWFVWLISWLVGAGVREPAGSRLRYLVLGYVIWLVVGAGLRVCGCAGLRVLGCVIRLVWLIGFSGFRHFIWLVWSISWRVGAGVQTRGNLQVVLSGWCGCAGFLLRLLVGALWVGIYVAMCCCTTMLP